MYLHCNADNNQGLALALARFIIVIIIIKPASYIIMRRRRRAAMASAKLRACVRARFETNSTAQHSHALRDVKLLKMHGDGDSSADVMR